MSEQSTRSLSRRQLLQGLGLIGATSLTAQMLAACAPGAPATPGGATQGTPAPATPRVGGDVRVDVLAEPVSLDPLRFNSISGQRIYRLVHNQLLRYRPDGSFEPDLAAAMPTVSADNLTYTFRLKPNVRWHDDRPFDSADVKFTFDTVLTAANASVWRAGVLSIESVEAPDPQTVVIRLREVFTPIMHKFALIPIISSKITPYVQNDTYAQRLVGTGPYRFVEWQRGVQLVLERNANYFEQGRPFINRVVARVVPENAARVTNLVNGQTQIIPEAPVTQLDLLRQRNVPFTIVDNSVTRVFIYPNFGEGRPARDVNIRQAIAWSIDRQLIIDQVFSGAAVPAATYLSSGSQYFDPQLGVAFGNRPNLERARQFLQQAGGPPREMLFVVQNLPDLVDVATILQANLRAAGIAIRISAEDEGSVTNRLLTTRDYDLLMIRASPGASAGFGPDYVALGLLTGASSNFNQFSDPQMDQLLRRALQAPENEAAAAWRAVSVRDLETLGQIQIVTTRYVEGHARSLQNYRPSALTTLAGIPDAFLA